MKNQRVVVWHYAGCDTCRKALRWLKEHSVSFEAIPIVDQPPSREELRELVAASGLPVRKFLNTSGGSYRALVESRGKAAVEALDDEALLALLAADGKMIKRPLLKAGEKVLVGFREDAYTAAFG